MHTWRESLRVNNLNFLKRHELVKLVNSLISLSEGVQTHFRERGLPARIKGPDR